MGRMNVERRGDHADEIPLIPSVDLPRDIAIFIDGTWNRSRTLAPTNVKKLFDATCDGVHNGREQRKLYVQGVGTRPKLEADALDDADYNVELQRHLFQVDTPVHTATSLAVIGGATGLGTAHRIRATYHYLCKHFRNKDLDRVFLFGFSRGAFAARSLAGFVGKVGLLFADKLEYVQRAYEIYENGEDPTQTELSEFLYQLTGRRFVLPDEEFYVPLHFLGVWDTVGALGLPSRLQWLTAPFTEYHQVECPPSVMTARHALALHELRGAFEPMLWESGSHPDLKQVWFPGAHADVGGGYRVKEDELSNTALRWMASEAEKAGLVVDKTAAWWLQLVGQPAIHHEIRGLFLATMPSPRSWLLKQDSFCWKSHCFHHSANSYVMNADKVSYTFKPAHVSAALRRVDVEALSRAIYLVLVG